MSNYNSTATATIYVNGQPAQQTIAKLKDDVLGYRKRLQEIATDKSLGVNSKEWNDVRKKMVEAEKELGRVQSGVANVTQAMLRLDKATPSELRKSLKQLKSELDNIERGSRAWDEHQRKIKAVKEELAKINNESKAVQGNLWDRFAKKMFDWGAAIQTVMATITGITMTARHAVESFAEMDQEMANVRKYTGMTTDEVERLNGEFKKMDTRTSREQLNQLAQEAGRLGMQSQEDVMGFVRAADKINVALDELGDGATLTLSKLTDIFGDRERLGVEKSLLAVGSVINELSQNCTASAPYIAEFASRLAGVGANAGMTTQQIMGYAAVMDSYGQKVESSATALSQVIVRLYRDPAKYAKVAGLDVRNFTDLLKKDANAALIQLLETLNKVGGMDVLSPMFADMGENGSRAIQALSTMAKHIDEVKAQQEVANQAFAEAISIDKEFNVQNNTVQAELEKAKKNFNEMAVALGEKLAPLMKYAITSSSAFMKAMSATIDFLVKYKTELVMLAVTIASYTVAVKAATLAVKADTAAKIAARVATAAWTAVTQLAYAAVAILSGNLKKAAMEMRIFAAVIHASPIGLLVAGITAACAGLALMVKRYGDNVKAATEAANKQREYLRSLRDVDSGAKTYSENEQARLKALYAATTNETLAREKRIEAAKQMQALYPDIFSNFSTEELMAGKAKNAYDQLTDSIIRNARARAAAEKILENEKAILDLEEENRKLRDQNKETRNQVVAAGERRRQAVEREDARRPINQDFITVDEGIHDLDRTINSGLNSINENVKVIKGNNQQIKERQEANAWLQKQYNVTGTENSSQSAGPQVSYTPQTSGASGKSGHGGSSPSGKEDKFAAENAWREREIALNKIAWRQGEKNYEEYQNRLLEIAVLYEEKRLAHTDLTENERLSIEALKLDAERKQVEQWHAFTLEDEDKYYKTRLMDLQDMYAQGGIEAEAYYGKLKEYELEHLRLVELITRNSAFASTGEVKDEEFYKQYVKAHEDYQKKLIQDQEEKQKEYQQNLQRHAEKMKETWNEYFISDKEKRTAEYEAAKALVDQAYREEIAKEGYTAEEKLEIERRYQAALRELRKKFMDENQGDKKLEDWVGEALDKIFGEGTWDEYGQVVKSMYNSIASAFDSLNKMAEAENQIRIARLEKYYEREISMAEGNAYKVQQLERRKEKQIAKIKAESAKKQYAQQVMAAVASTAQAAINAYASATKEHWLLGAVAAAMALAAGGIQIAAIRKQQQASLAQGYAEGGFTPKGRPDEAVGVVHAGEWVASQKLLQNPQARAAIETLDYAQRNNAYGVISQDDVTRQLSAPSVIAGAASDGSTMSAMVTVAAVLGRYSDTMQRLGERLNEPFVTINTITGDMGQKKAQDDYQSLMNNTLPRNKRK